MSWQDLGLIFRVNKQSHWMQSHAYVPTALDLEDRIRVYIAAWDEQKYGRLGYIDVHPHNPTEILGISEKPILEDAKTGSFDEHGVTPLSVIKYKDEIRLYYAGWQQVDDPYVRYKLFMGLCISECQGDKFVRFSEAPVVGPTNQNYIFRSGGFFLHEKNNWHCWYGEHVDQVEYDGKLGPRYSLNYMSSPDGLNWPSQSTPSLPIADGRINGYGRGNVWVKNDIYNALFSVRGSDGLYRKIIRLQSKDKINWTEKTNDDFEFTPARTLDNQNEVCFPNLIFRQDKIIMFYNGNEFGREGLRAAIYTL